MTLRFNVLGFDLWRLQLDIERVNTIVEPIPTSPLDKGIKAMSGFWVRRMMSRA